MGSMVGGFSLVGMSAMASATQTMVTPSTTTKYKGEHLIFN